MTMSKTAAATRAVLQTHREEALNGQLTVDQVIELVKQVVPHANDQGIYNAIEAYGPIGENDQVWERRVQQAQIPSWFYNPTTGEALE